MPGRKIALVVGARPNFMKSAPLMKELRKYPEVFDPILIHTGQHYDHCLSQVFFDDLKLPRPDHYLEVGSGSHAEQTARIMLKLEKVLQEIKPDMVMVFGDVNSTIAAAVVVSKLCLPLAHVESGLRSFDKTMPEEINRVVTDCLSDYLFVSEKIGLKHLKNEGIPDHKVFFTGNIMIDALVNNIEIAKKSNVLQRLQLPSGKYIVMTMHRPANVDNPITLERMLLTAVEISRWLPVVFPCHPRTRKIINEYELADKLNDSRLMIIDPLGYLDFLKLQNDTRMVLTDSGGTQVETTYLGIPCLTLRETTELEATVEKGTNTLCGTNPDKILATVARIKEGKYKQGQVPELWDGSSSERMVRILKDKL